MKAHRIGRLESVLVEVEIVLGLELRTTPLFITKALGGYCWSTPRKQQLFAKVYSAWVR